MLGGCGIYRTGKPWSFSLTSELLDKIDRDEFPSTDPAPCVGNRSSDPWGLVCVLAPVLAPVAVDIVLLPMTGVHDLWIGRR